MFVGCALFAAVLLANGVQSLPDHLPSLLWIGLVVFGLGWLLVATTGTQWGVTHMEAGRSSIIIIMELVTAVLSAALIQGNHLHAMEWTGGLLILTAAVLEAWRPDEV
jgi:drug/metabolite transporter (DMT)-like permease